MSDSGYKSLYSVLIFLLAFSIINFYARKIKDEKRFKLEQLKINELKLLETEKKFYQNKRQVQVWTNLTCCRDCHQRTCHRLEIFMFNVNLS